jgi:DNA-directed RNA polymerase specialized sigma subunit
VEENIMVKKEQCEKKREQFVRVKEYLQRAYRKQEFIASDMRELERLRALSTSVAAIDYGREKVSSSVKTSSNVEDIVMKICKYEDKIKREMDELIAVQTEIRDTIMQVKHTNERLVLKLRYIDFMDWNDISEEMGYSYRQVTRLHGEALRNLKI